jgi:hypothetical protein
METSRVLPSAPPTSFYRFGSDRFYLIGAGIVVLSYVLEAPVRYVLGMVSLDLLIYLRDAVIAAYVVTAALSWTQGQVSAFPVIIVSALLTLHTLIGILTLNNVVQPLFGLKIFLPLLLGLVIGPLIQARPREVAVFAGWCFAVTAIGVALNAVLDFPWIGASYDTPLGTRELSRKWWTGGGGARLPGFTRASYFAAQLMLTSLVPLLAARPKLWLRITLTAIAGAIIFLTTSKAPWTGLAALFACDVLLLAKGLRPLVGMITAVLFVVCVALPIISLQLGAPSGPVPSWAISFVERITDMWPGALALYDGPASVIFGRGVGGIGSAQALAEARVANSADNLMLFLLVSFGPAGVIYLGVVVARLAARVSSSPLSRSLHCAHGWMIVILAVGLTSQMIEDPVSNISLGISIALSLIQPMAATPTRLAHSVARLTELGSRTHSPH